MKLNIDAKIKYRVKLTWVAGDGGSLAGTSDIVPELLSGRRGAVRRRAEEQQATYVLCACRT